MHHCPRTQALVSALFWGLLTMGLVHALVHAVAHVARILPPEWGALPSWTYIDAAFRPAHCASLLSLGVAGGAALILARRHRGRSRRGYTVTGVLLLVWLLEDAIRWPEVATYLAPPRPPRDAALVWSILATLASIVIGFACLRFLHRKNPERPQSWMILGGFGCLVAATGIDWVGAMSAAETRPPRDLPISQVFLITDCLLRVLGPLLLFRCLGKALAAPRF